MNKRKRIPEKTSFNKTLESQLKVTRLTKKTSNGGTTEKTVQV